MCAQRNTWVTALAQRSAVIPDLRVESHASSAHAARAWELQRTVFVP